MRTLNCIDDVNTMGSVTTCVPVSFSVSFSMGLNSEDAYTAELQTVLRIAHALRDATAISCPPSHYLTTSTPTIVLDPISLPTPQPLLPSLLEAGIGFEIASAASQIYQRRAEQFKQHIQESVAATCRKTAESPVLAHASPPDLLMKRVVSIFTDVYFRRLEEWKQEIIQRIKQASELPTKATPRNSRTFNQVSLPNIRSQLLLVCSIGIRSTIGALFRRKPVPDACR